MTWIMWPCSVSFEELGQLFALGHLEVPLTSRIIEYFQEFFHVLLLNIENCSLLRCKCPHSFYAMANFLWQVSAKYVPDEAHAMECSLHHHLEGDIVLLPRQ